MQPKRRPSTPRQYREDFIARIEAARLVAGMDREQVVDALCKRTGLPIKLDTYKNGKVVLFYRTIS